MQRDLFPPNFQWLKAEGRGVAGEVSTGEPGSTSVLHPVRLFPVDYFLNALIQASADLERMSVALG